jgi:hypothetical protein
VLALCLPAWGSAAGVRVTVTSVPDSAWLRQPTVTVTVTVSVTVSTRDTRDTVTAAAGPARGDWKTPIRPGPEAVLESCRILRPGRCSRNRPPTTRDRRRAT